MTAENVARKYGVSREARDEFACASQRRAATEAAKSVFAEEITPVEVGGRKPFTVTEDGHPKPETTLAKLRPAFEKGGLVTAGNASGINDGAAALVLARESVATQRGLTGLVSLEAVATAAMEPELMGYAPVLVLNKLFEMTGTAPHGTLGHRHHRVERGVRVPGGRRGPGRQARSGEGQSVRRCDRAGSSGGATGAILTLRVAKDLVRRDLELGSSRCASVAVRRSPRCSGGCDMAEFVAYSVTDGVARMELNRPDAANALDLPLARQLRATAVRAGEDDVRAVLVTGSGSRFCAVVT